jgi:hypothetical protein
MSELSGDDEDAEAGVTAPPQGHHSATPPWPEQVPLWVKLCESVPSRQMAVTFDGELSGDSTQVW